MTTFTRQPDKTLAILGLMRDLAERGHGYVALGVAGWARTGDVNALLEVYYSAHRYAGQASEELRWGAEQRGYYDRIDVRVKGAKTPVIVYRVTDAAARMLNEGDGREHVPIPPPAEGPEAAVWMPDTAPIALQELIRAADNPGEPLRIPKEPEWRSSLELTNALKKRVQAEVTAREKAGKPAPEEGRDPSFQHTDFKWLAGAGFAEMRREGGLVLYRVTAAGRQARALEWHGPVPSFMKRVS